MIIYTLRFFQQLIVSNFCILKFYFFFVKQLTPRVVLFQVQVADPKHRIVKLGALRVGQSVRKTIPIINRSPAPLTFSLALTPSSVSLQEHRALRIAPTQQITLAANGGTAKVDVAFGPKMRIPPFTEEVRIQCPYIYTMM